MRKILITGGSGFIGQHLVRKLKQHNEVSVLIHKTDVREDVKKYYGDVLSKDSLKTIFRDFNPDVIFHLAAQPIVRNSDRNGMDYETIKTNIDGTQNVLDASLCLNNLNRIICISTDKVYGDTDYIKPNSPLNGVKHPYNASKLAGDVLSQMFGHYYGAPVAIIRNGNVYGEGDLHWDRIIPRTIKRIKSNQPPIIRGNGGTWRDYIYVGELVGAYEKLLRVTLTKDEPLIVNLGSEKCYATGHVVHKIIELMKRVDLCPIYETSWKGEIPAQHIDNAHAEELIGWKPVVDLDAGLSICVPWYEQYLQENTDDTRSYSTTQEANS